MMSVVSGKGSTLFLQNRAGSGYCADVAMIVNGANETRTFAKWNSNGLIPSCDRMQGENSSQWAFVP
jgi:hypothetical protein